MPSGEEILQWGGLFLLVAFMGRQAIGLIFRLPLLEQINRHADKKLPTLSWYVFVAGCLFLIGERFNFSDSVNNFLNNVLVSLTSLAFFWLARRFGDGILGTGPAREWLDANSLYEIVKRVMHIIFYALTGMALLQIWGIPVVPLLGGLGLLGIAVALGAQDLFQNLLAGFVIITEKRFEKGDTIEVEGIVQGTVEHIGLRSTRIRRFDQIAVVVPNSTFSASPLCNWTSRPFRRIYWKIGLEYDSTIDQLQKICADIRNWITESGDFQPHEKHGIYVYVNGFSDSSIDILLYCFTTTLDWAKCLKIQEKLALKIMEIVAHHGASFAFPSRTIYVRKEEKEEKEENSLSSFFSAPRSVSEAASVTASERRENPIK